MNFEPRETVPIYWFFAIFNLVKIKLNQANFFLKLEWLKFATLEMRRDWSQMRPAVVSGIGGMFLGFGVAHSDIGEFVFPVPSNSPRSVKNLNPGVIS